MATKKPTTKKTAKKPTIKEAKKPIKPITVKKPIKKAKPQTKAVVDKMKLPDGGKVFVKVCGRPNAKARKPLSKKSSKN